MSRLTRDQLTDKGRYEFRIEDVELPELGGSVAVKTLSVAERDSLPDMTEPLVDKSGKPVLNSKGEPVMRPTAKVADLAKIWAATVCDPKLTAAEAEKFLGDLPASALDRVIEKFGELLGTKEDAATTGREFPQTDDGPAVSA